MELIRVILIDPDVRVFAILPDVLETALLSAVDRFLALREKRFRQDIDPGEVFLLFGLP